MEELLQQILDGQAQIIKRLNNIENSMVTKDMFHHSMTEGQKDIIAMLETAATKDSIADLKASIQVINNRLFDQETKLQKLEIVK
ncbi:hypothetical protein Ga0466249_000191 [Sporomusaceae bacterium BoRhaA]|uniref:hypothetical protein n=1 Tax=Pelorhabdus rhamnosifermentans TaxID=2772457 RepID=UPI001C061324|nr:hypothetical protein [Pelorhabdus rhamnosifermentans]MBU2699112.1 hypothetical protein [Pelorhabdus rhamnosifermentans]